MKLRTTVAAAALVAAVSPALAADAGGRFHIGLTYMSHLADLRDKIEANNPLVDVDQLTSFGLAFSGYYLLSSGLAFGGAIGPAIVATGDASFYIVPVSAGVRYQFVRAESVAAYGGAALEHYLVGGDFVDTGSPGAALTLGLEVSKPRGLGWGVEAGYHSASVNVSATPGRSERKARPGRFTLGVFFLF
jgi:hypothetical protein